MHLGIELFIAASVGCSLGYVLGASVRAAKQADIAERNLHSGPRH
jgi:hypothetical protein